SGGFGFGLLTVRVLLLWGAVYVGRSRATAAHLVASVSEGCSVEVAGVAHMIQLEAPERVSEELRDFIQDYPL
ncbi:MAG: hypothetical protein OXT64_14985, partial [Gammaproteobacteria bacterium]|nr:hypothetical protein [Gammaproteobacteria bacterium]